ncbi:MAG: hypothetical protein M3276_10830 [Actinomycetota bacterium]|nr:hypothetical protein [Actinomycetota bacterium]
MSPEAAPVTTTAPQDVGQGGGRGSLSHALRPILGFFANLTVLTALLVYFGWRRSATQAERLGIAESILGMSSRDYLLRSVRPVLVLLVGVSVAGLAWVILDRWLQPLVRSGAQRSGAEGATDRRFVWVLRTLSVAWILLPALVWLIGFVWPAPAFVLFPVSIGTGVLLILYVAHLRQLDSPPDDAARGRNLALQVSTALLVGVCLFWAAANYAHVEGVQLARDIVERTDRLPGVIVYSRGRLHLDGPGVSETELSQVEGDLRYRHRGLRLLEHTGGKYFLISDGWTATYGVVFVLRADDESLRIDFIRDRR